jgi:protocatechuate 3,4-dioxygenase beta subunit
MISRRHLLRASATTALGALLAACSKKLKPGAAATPSGSATPTSSGTPLPACVLRPEVTEGPYFIDERLNRSDIRSDPSDGSIKPGAELQIVFNVSRVRGPTCEPLVGAQVDVWHCDAGGLYSDEAANNTTGKKFLRGYQNTDASGVARFTTIFPGWYSGRAIHIHFKIRILSAGAATFQYTSQLFFDEVTTNAILAQEPYKARGAPDTRNASDGVYASNDSAGTRLMLPITLQGAAYVGTFDVGLQAS